jgi:hypothetical protein
MTSLIPKDISFNRNKVLVNEGSNKDLLYQNGEYSSSASSIINETNDAFKAFDNNPTTFWVCNNSLNINTETKYKQDSYNGFMPSSYIGGGSDDIYWKTIANNKQYVGEWIQIKLPYSSYLEKYSILSTQFPRKFHLLGSNDGTSWELLDSQTLDTDYSGKTTPTSFKVKTILKCNQYRLVISQLFNGTSASINEFNLYGNRNTLANLKSLNATETFSNYNNYTDYTDYRSSYNTKINSQYYSNISKYNSMEYIPFSKFDVVDTNKITEQFASLREPLEINDMNIAINELNDKSNIANKNYGNLVSGINNYLYSKNELLNSSLYDYSGNILFLNNGKPTLKDALENDAKEFAVQENNVFILGSVSLAILLVGTYVILRN